MSLEPYIMIMMKNRKLKLTKAYIISYYYRGSYGVAGVEHM